MLRRPATRPRRRFVLYGTLLYATVVLVAASVTTASAQPNRDAGASQLLDVTLDINGAYDTDASQDVVFPSPGQLQPQGYSAWGVGTLNYINRSTRNEWQAFASSAVRYLPDLKEFHSVMHSGGVSIAAGLPDRFTLNANASFAYSPSYLYSLFPTLPSASDAQPVVDYSDPYDLDPSSSYSLNSSIALERRISRRSSISVVADFAKTYFSNESAAEIPEIPEIPTEITTRPDLAVYSIGGRFSRNISRDGSLSVGYTYRTGEFGYAVGRTTASHSINFGGNISRQVSASRRVNFNFTVGGTAVDTPDFAQFNVVQQYRVDAEVSASYPISRTWQLRGSYTRGLQYVAGLSRPVFADGFTADVNGRVLRRIDVLGRVSRAAGQSVVTRDTLLDTYTSELKVTYLVTRGLNAYVDYIHYVFDSGGELDTPQIPLVTGIPADLNRDTIHVGVSWLVPAFRK